MYDMAFESVTRRRGLDLGFFFRRRQIYTFSYGLKSHRFLMTGIFWAQKALSAPYIKLFLPNVTMFRSG